MKVQTSRLHRLFYPQVPLVLAAQVGKRVSAMLVVSYAAVSDSPPLVAVFCIPKAFTYLLCVKARAFSLSVIDARRLGAIEELARVRGSEVQDKLLRVGLKHKLGRSVAVPVIAESLATIECSLHSRRMLGDHSLLVGEVESCYASRSFREFWDFTKYTPILYTGWRDGITTYSRSSEGD
jgi:flavin reductase (DIM6/NTAB) family NADH-FMN oxidoreductase RutF